MKKTCYLLTLLILTLSAGMTRAQKITILGTNDTHSQIDPDERGRSGALQRKAVIDSVRKADKNVLLVDAGDAVQGSLYFKFFKGDVESKLMDMMGYDIRVLGNHEFDNGMEELAKYWKPLKGRATSANYDFSNTALKGVFAPYIIKTIARRKVGFFGLNVDPASLIAAKNIAGVKFNDIIKTANSTAAYLRNKKHCDLVVAVTHIGYNTKQEGKQTDVDLARNSRDIDIIIGGHSHTLVTPGSEGKYPSVIPNADGRPVIITQTGKTGAYIADVQIDFNGVKKGERVPASAISYKLIPVTDRFPAEQLDKKMMAWLAPYKHVVDSINAHTVAYAPNAMHGGGLGEYANWTADMAFHSVQQQLDSIHQADPQSTLPANVDLAIMNGGGIRLNLPQGNVSEGRILSTFPFPNRFTLIELSGKDLLQTLKIMARRHGEAISQQVKVAVDPDWSFVNATINDEPIDPDKNYVIATIDYLAQGNDDLRPLANGKVLWTDSRDVAVPIMRYVTDLTKMNMPMSSDPSPRFVQAVHIKP